jgi:hypothetical protein
VWLYNYPNNKELKCSVNNEKYIGSTGIILKDDIDNIPFYAIISKDIHKF